jgi:peptidoglycan/xylan/chitin deacetylase (PgdA/CDA1 family)
MLLTLSFFVFSLDLGNTYIGIVAPLYNGKKDGSNVAFMFVVDDIKSSAAITAIMGTLTNANAGATFFVSGMFVGSNLELTKELSDDFEVGNYGFSNIKLNINDKVKIKNEIIFCNDLIKSVTGKDTKLFTPPQQLYNKTTLTAASELNYKTILPTARNATINWTTADTNLVASYATEGVKAGDIILFRPTAAAVQSLARIISYFLEQNFNILSVSDIL